MDVISQLQTALAERYVIEREIGRGGMATVYLARDVKHRRQVAVKVLDPELGAVLGVDRFLSEIRVTANLQHPNLLPLFDSGEANGLLFYVMPFVEGESLRHRLERDKQLPIEEAVRLSTAIAGALDYAHRHGVIHRDLKPENILLHDGQPLVADFGIALAVSNAGGERVTQTGLSLGTPQYMSPEQATGDREIDGRTDIYSLGAITYEMLSGEPPHLGNSAQAIIARLMTEDPRPLSAVRRSVPVHVEEAVHCALQRLPADRFPSGKDFAESLLGAKHSTLTRSVRGEPAAARGWRRAFWMATAAAIVGLAGFVWAVTRPDPELPTVRFRADDDAHRVFLLGMMVAVSADGRSITYLAGSDSTPQLMTRRVGDLESTPFAAAGDLQYLSEFRYSNDGRWLVLRVGQRLLRVSSSGGAPAVVTSNVQARYGGLAVTNDGDAIYPVDGVLMRARPSSVPTVLARPDTTSGELGLGAPLVLPDGKHIAFRITRRQDTGLTDPVFTDAPRRLGTVDLDGGKRRSFELPIANPIGYADGWLIYGTPAGEINAVEFDPDGGVKGAPITVLTGVTVNFVGEVQASLSPAGTLAYARRDIDRRVVLLDADGTERSRLPEGGNIAHPSWSPDGGRIAFDDDGDIWVHDVASRASLRLTSVGGSRPAWTPDGTRIGFINTRSEIWWVPADGSAKEELLHRPSDGAAREVGFTPDGRFVLFRFDRGSPAAVRLVRDIQMAPIGGGESRALVSNGYANSQAAISPDGRWIAYSSDETDRREVYVRAVAGGGRVPVSVGGGIEPRWMSNTQLVYRARPQRAFWRATLSPGSGGVVVTRRDSLIADPYANGSNNPPWYDVTPDGRFVVLRDEGRRPELIAVVNWVTELREILKAR